MPSLIPTTDTNYIGDDPKGYSWNIIHDLSASENYLHILKTSPQAQSESDDLMLRHAVKCGVLIFQESKVTQVDSEGSLTKTHPITISWKTAQGTTRKTMFNCLIDASR